MIISHSSYNRELLKWQRAGGTVWQDDCWPIDILDECPVNFKAINFNIISAIYSNLVWLYFNEDKLPKMIGNSDWYIRISSEFTPRTIAHQETWSMTTDVFHIGHPTAAAFHSIFTQSELGEGQGGCSCWMEAVFWIGCNSHLWRKPWDIVVHQSERQRKGDESETSSQTSQSQVHPWKLTWSLKIASLKNENCLLPS